MPTSYFITYKKQSGELISVISSYHPEVFLMTPSSPCLKELAQQGEAFLAIPEQEIKTYSDINSYYYSFTDQKLIKKPPQSAPHLTFSYDTYTWEDTRTLEEVWKAIRKERDKLLMETDWTQLPDVPEATKTKYAIYRQALRDITTQENPYNIKFPLCPS